MKAIIDFYNTVVQQAVFPNLNAGRVAELINAARLEIAQLTSSANNAPNTNSSQNDAPVE